MPYAKSMANAATQTKLTAAQLGTAAGERWAKKRIKMNAPVGRLGVASASGSSHLVAWDRGDVGPGDVVAYCQAFIDAVFATLEPKGLVTL